MAAHSYEIGLVMAAMENAGASSRSLLRPSSSKKPASQKFQSLDPEMQARDSTDSYESSMKGDQSAQTKTTRHSSLLKRLVHRS